MYFKKHVILLFGHTQQKHLWFAGGGGGGGGRGSIQEPLRVKRRELSPSVRKLS